MYRIVEKFISINGEGPKAGQLAVFIRFAGCNLRCSYCDTMWANMPDTQYQEMNAEEIYQYIKASGIKNVTITGGEPLIQPGITALIELLTGDSSLYVEIETNGSASIKAMCELTNPPSLTMDYKLPSSGMEQQMNTDNFQLLTDRDTVKFVCGSQEDLKKAYSIIKEYRLTERCGVILSPVFGKITPEKIVDFMKENKLNDVKIQLQMHKFIWPPEMKGV